jgi:hypothetical protein
MGPRSSTILLFLLTASASAQGTLHKWSTAQGYATYEVASAGDVDGDGAIDVATVVDPIQGPYGGQRLKVFSSLSGVELLDTAAIAGLPFGPRLHGLGDIDVDGSSDVLMGGTTKLRAVSGASGAVLWERQVASEVRWLAAMDDLDLDGHPDVLVGRAGAAEVVSALGGGVLLSFAPPAGATTEFGRSLVAVGDLDLDGVRDVAVGNSHATPTSHGSVALYSGAGGAPLGVVPPTPETIIYGAGGYAWSMAAPGDVDGDGVPDLAVGSAVDCVIPPTFEGCTVSGKAYFYSGATGAWIRTVVGTVAGFGTDMEAVADMDGDGIGDVLVASNSDQLGCCIYFAGTVDAVSGATGAIFQTGYDQSTGKIAVVDDVDGDGLADYAAADRLFGGGVTLNLSAHTPPAYVEPCPGKQTSEGCWPQIGFSGAPSLSIGPDIALETWGVVGGTIGLFLWSPSPAATPMGGATLCVGAPFQRGPAQATGGSAGACQGTFAHTFSKSELLTAGYTAGDILHVQAWFRDPGYAPPQSMGLSKTIAATLWP